MTIAAIIVAAGQGVRAGGDQPKQWQEIVGRMMIDHTIDAFADAPSIDRIVLVLDPEDHARRKTYEAQGFWVASGGDTRSASVCNGLARLDNTEVDWVLIHDAARPCVSQRLIADMVAVRARADAAAPALAVTDALWIGTAGQVSGTRQRTGLYRAQTPQAFDYRAIRAAHAQFQGEAADDVEVARAYGLEVVIVQGNEDNLKVTLPGDFARAGRILRNSMNIRLGNGFDVHAFCPGSHVTLCGVSIPHDRGLRGHSDADVGMHAVTDAIYGALAQGDIGQHFPPSDPQWKDADSRIFLSHAAGLARDMGFGISNVDITLICEAPKIGPHAPEMRQVVADIMGIDMGAVSVKATTSEQLGFTGRGEGIAAMATAALVAS